MRSDVESVLAASRAPSELGLEIIDKPLLERGKRPTLPTLETDGKLRAAYTGLAGEFTRKVAQYSEADPAAILLHTLIAAGCYCGTGPHVLVEHAPHHSRLFSLLVGRTAGGRKGTAWNHPKALFQRIDQTWTETHVKNGLSSGEGLVYHVRDADGADDGVSDKRLMVLESEFSSVLKSMQRDGCTLSQKLRDSWDGLTLQPMTKRERLTATHPHICIVGHCTQDELVRELAETDRTNGFANRFLFAYVEKSQDLPHGTGAPVEILEQYRDRFAAVLTRAQSRGALSRDADAAQLWAEVYPDLNIERPGITGAMLGRAPAQVLRLSLIYSLLDEREASSQTPAIRPHHLMAALDLWDFCEASTAWIFGDLVGDPVADRLLRAIKTAPQTDTDLWGEIKGLRCDEERKDMALDLLLGLKRIHGVRIPTIGRPIRQWHFGPSDNCGICGNKGIKPPSA